VPHANVDTMDSEQFKLMAARFKEYKVKSVALAW